MTSPKVEREYLHFPDFESFDDASKLATSNREALSYSSTNGVPQMFFLQGHVHSAHVEDLSSVKKPKLRGNHFGR